MHVQQTCRHFRYQLPRELADELRDADPIPCEVCDSMPHRKWMVNASIQTVGAQVSAALRQSCGIMDGAESSGKSLLSPESFSAGKSSAASDSMPVRGWLARIQTVLRPHH